MAYIPGCRYDLFISYATEDNANEWVERFKDALITALGHHLGRHFTAEFVFFDKTELRVGQAFPRELRSAAEASAVFLPLLSNHWLTSDWCYQERRAFFSRLPHQATDAECLAAVTVRPVEPDVLDEFLRHAERFPFFDAQTKEPPAVGSPQWESLIRTLAEQIKDILRDLHLKCRPVFLGRACCETTDKLRTLVAEEFGKRLFRVTPENYAEYEDRPKLLSQMQAAALRVHFLGGMQEKEIVAVEDSLESSQGATVLIRPFGVETLSAEEQLWLAQFRQNMASRAALQIFEGKNDQDVVEMLRQEITRPEDSPPQEAARPVIGVICEERDFTLARLLKDEIERRDSLKVQYPGFLKTPAKWSEQWRKWQELLRNSRGLLFCWGESNLDTLETIWRLAAEQRPEGHRQWYVTPPDLDTKRDKFPDCICQREQFDYARLHEFLKPLVQREGAG